MNTLNDVSGLSHSEPGELKLTDADRALLNGEHGAGARLAMQIIVRVAEATRAPSLVDISWAHVASAYYNGPINVDFAERLVALGARVSVPTTLTACSYDLRRLDDSEDSRVAVRLIDLYREMGCQPEMTCAPYHVRREPRFGEHLAWSESSAVVYANSVLGARTNRYVEFLDMCAAITGRVPNSGLHRRENRRATTLVRLQDLPARWLEDDRFYQVLGFLIGRTVGDSVPVLVGLPGSVTAEQLRALGSAGAASGSLSMFHAVGVTPEAPSVEDACQSRPPRRTQTVGRADIRAVARDLSASADGAVSGVCLGAPHFSLTEFEQLVRMFEGRRVKRGVRCYVSTSRHVAAEIEVRGWLEALEAAGIDVITDRCTYYAPVLEGCDGPVVTNSAKWAYYAPGNLGAQTHLASLQGCVDAAVTGRIAGDEEF